jgi:ABC-type antimicrobial peptide transport system permease subunit
LAALNSTRTRTALTTLGVVIGVASITFVLAVGGGAQNTVAQQVKKLDNNIILVRPGQEHSAIDRQTLNYSPLYSYATTTLTEDDADQLRHVPGVKAVAPLMLINGSVRHNNQVSGDTPVVATTPDLAKILNLNVGAGQFLDDTTDDSTVVIGQQLAVDLYGTDQPLGEQLKIRGRTHTVIGVLSNVTTPTGINGVDLNHSVVVSLNDGKSFNQGLAQVQQINIAAKNPKQIPDLVTKIHKTLLQNHQGEEDFTVVRGDQASSISEQFYHLVVIVTAIIAAISLIVGGIGIMNIMLVGVTERTREIGIRKSLGATHQQIWLQFLIEAIIVSLSGGIIGLVIAYLVAFSAGDLIPFVPIINWQIIALSLGLPLLIGVIFGLFPAISAARKDPIEALRQRD